MKTNNYTPIAILALNLESEEKEQAVLSELVGSEYKRPALLRCYKGQTERSYILTLTDDICLEAVIDFSKKYNQQSVLYLDNQRFATLYFDANTAECVGQFKRTSKKKALAQDAYNFNPETNTYYIVE